MRQQHESKLIFGASRRQAWVLALAFLLTTSLGLSLYRLVNLADKFSLSIDEGILDPDFDFKVSDENILPDGFEENASETGQELKPEIMRMRQRAKKASLTHRLESLDENREILEPQCNVIH